MRRYQIDCFTYEPRRGALARVARAITNAGGFVEEHRIVSADRVELVIELRARAGMELYFALAAQGVELSRGAQQN